MKRRKVNPSSISQAWFLISSIILISLASMMLTNGMVFFPGIDLSSNTAQFYYWITSSASVPNALLTAFVILILCYLKLSHTVYKRYLFATFLGLFLALGTGQILKIITKEIRPQIALMAQYRLLDINQFYQLDKTERQSAVKQAISKLEKINPNIHPAADINRHWQKSTNYAFPSAHVTFAVTMTLISNYYMIMSGAVILPVILMSWSLVMGWSRLFLGVHWPLDVFGATLLAILCSLASVYLIEKYLNKPKVKPHASQDKHKTRSTF